MPDVNENTSNFELVRTLGGGEYGVTHLYRYKGNHPELKMLSAPEGFLVVKKSRIRETLSAKGEERQAHLDVAMEVDRNEKHNISYLRERDQNSSNVSHPRGVVAGMDDGTEWIVIEPVACGHEANNHPLSYDLEKFLTNLANNMSNYPDDNQCAALALALHGFSQSIEAAMSELHRQRILHLDCAARNFLLAEPKYENGRITFSLKLIDFGLSRRIPAGEDKVTHIYTAEMPYKFPVRWMDQQSCRVEKVSGGSQLAQKRIYSDRTDIFGIKATMIEMAGLMLGMRSDESLSLMHGQSYMDFYLRRRNVDDEQALNTFLHNVRVRAGFMLATGNKTAAIVMEFINAYQAYLTRMPDVSLSREQFLQADHELFARASADYAETLDARLADKNENQKKMIKGSLLPQSGSRPAQALPESFYLTPQTHAPAGQLQAAKAATGHTMFEKRENSKPAAPVSPTQSEQTQNQSAGYILFSREQDSNSNKRSDEPKPEHNSKKNEPHKR